MPSPTLRKSAKVKLRALSEKGHYPSSWRFPRPSHHAAGDAMTALRTSELASLLVEVLPADGEGVTLVSGVISRSAGELRRDSAVGY